MINIFMNSSYPVRTDITSHELNSGGGRKLSIAFWQDEGTPYDLTKKTVTATFVTNNRLIADSVEVTEKGGNTIVLDISSTDEYTMIPGVMLVEFVFTEDEEVCSPATALVVNVKGSIKNNAHVTPESYGTVAEILQEVANARGGYPNLNARIATMNVQLHNIDNDQIKADAIHSENIKAGEVKTANLANEAVTKEKLSLILQSFVDNGYVQKIATVSTLSELEAKLYHINPCIYFLTLTGACATAFNVQSGAKARLIMFGDWNSSITRWLKIIDNGAEWTQALTISNDTYTFGTWTRLSKELLYGELPSELVDEINTKISYDSAVITNSSQLNSANYAVPEIELGVKLTSQAAAGFQVESGTIGLLKTVEADGVIKRYMTFPEIEGVKWVQTVNSIAPSWSAGIWTKVVLSNEFDIKIDKPTKCIYFDEDDCVYTLTSGIHTGGVRVGITSVYVPSSVTEIPDRALVSTPDLTTIYIDNAFSAVTLGTDIQAAVNNEELIIYYKGQFNLANILATSQKKLNSRLISLEATVGTVNTILENAINGVS